MDLFTKLTIGSVAGLAAFAAFVTANSQPSQEYLAAQANKQQAEQAAKAPKLSNYEVCLKTQQDLTELGVDPSKMDCEAVKNYRTPAQRIAAAGGQTQLIRGCEAILKPVLNDPNSYRYVSGHIFASTDKELSITVRYTATNAFGGRVQGTYDCTTQA